MYTCAQCRGPSFSVGGGELQLVARAFGDRSLEDVAYTVISCDHIDGHRFVSRLEMAPDEVDEQKRSQNGAGCGGDAGNGAEIDATLYKASRHLIQETSSR